MKKFIVILIILFISITAFSQVRLGYSLNEIRKEFPATSELIYIKTTPVVIITYPEVEVFHYFNENYKCYQTNIVTSSQNIASEIMDLYNKIYIRTSQDTWKMYTNHNVSFIKFIYSKKKYIFTWN